MEEIELKNANVDDWILFEHRTKPEIKWIGMVVKKDEELMFLDCFMGLDKKETRNGAEIELSDWEEGGMPKWRNWKVYRITEIEAGKLMIISGL